MENKCEGCRTFTGDYCGIGLIPDLSDTDGCPCQTCLVKTMCHHDICDKFIEYRSKSRVIRSYRKVSDDIVTGNISMYKGKG